MVLLGLPAAAQDLALPTVGDSPTALALCRRAEDLRDANPAEAARLVHRILDEFADRLVPADDADDRFISASERANSLLRASPRVRDEWKRIGASMFQRLVEEGDDEALVRVAVRAPEGAAAALRLAQRRLEAGRPAAALAMLDRFDPEVLPDPRARGFAASMRRTALDLLRLGERAEGQGIDPGSDGRSWPRIWRLGLPNAPFARRYLNPVTGPLLTVPTGPQALEEGSLLTVMPLVSGDRVYLSEGHVVTAIDRLSRRVRWQRALSHGDDLEVASIADASELALAGDTLVVLTGHGSPTRRTGGGRVVALDRESGQVLWERSLAGLEPPDLEGGDGLFPHGAPLVVDDVVVVMARKVNTRLESVGTAIGLDLHTGRVRWATYIAGCGSRPMSGMRPFASPIGDAGSIFVATSLGAIARLDPSTGAIRWLLRSLVPTADGLATPVPWENSTPVLTQHGLLSISPDQSLLLVVDPQTGSLRRRIVLGRGEAWGQPRYLLASRDGSRVLAVGDDAVLFAADDLDRPKWRLGATLREAAIPTVDAPIRGRVAFADEPIDGRSVVLVPLVDRLLMLDAADGSIVRSIDTGRPGNPLLVNGQVIVAAADRLDCYMPLAAAERAVRDWMARDPVDATRAMALLELGIQCGVPSMILEGAATAGAALDRADDDVVRTELVLRILDGVVKEVKLPEADVRRLLEVATSLARRSADVAACALAEGDWLLAGGRPGEAIDAWQRVLASPTLRRAVLQTAEGSTPASSLVMARLSALVEGVGGAVLAPRERAADAALRSSGAAATPAELAELAEAWAGTAAGASAAVRAAEGELAAGAALDAFMLVAAALRARSLLAGVDDATRALVDTLASIARRRAWQDAAASELVALLDRLIAAPAATRDAQRAVREAIVALAPHDPSVRTLPSIGAQPATATQIRGRLASLSAGAESERPLDRALVVERGDRSAPRVMLSLRHGPGLESVWQRPIDAEDPEVLAFGDDIILWQRGPGIEPSLMSVAAHDGATRWVIPSVAQHFDASRATAVPGAPRRGLRERGFISPQEMVPIRAGPWILVVRRNGDLLCIDARDGSVRWRRDGVVSEFTGDLGARGGQVAASSMLIAVAGGRRDAAGAIQPFVSLIDPERGDPLGVIDLPATGDVDWVTIAPGPLVLAGVRSTVIAIRPGDAQPLWTRSDHRLAGGAAALVAGEHLLVVAQRPGARRDEIVAIDLHRGTIDAQRFPVPTRRSFGASRLGSLQRVADGIVAGFTDRVLLFDVSGRLRGQDAVAAEHAFALVLPARETLVVVDPDSSRSFFANPDRSGSAQPAAVLYQLSRTEGGRLAAEPIAVPVGDQTADRWLLLDGAVVGSGLDWCTVIPMPAGSPR